MKNNRYDYYVYEYRDPRNDKVFYIGKGCGSRFGAHLFEDGESEKNKLIREITDSGLKPVINIIAQKLTKNEAFLVEASLIECIGLDNLTNKVSGHRHSKVGKISSELFDVYSENHSVDKKDFTEPTIGIVVNNLYDKTKTKDELYDITRAYWKIGADTMKRAKYAVAIYNQRILEVYEIIRWDTSLKMKTRSDSGDGKRFGFVGKVAPQRIRRKFVGKNTKFVSKSRNPIRKFGFN